MGNGLVTIAVESLNVAEFMGSSFMKNTLGYMNLTIFSDIKFLIKTTYDMFFHQNCNSDNIFDK